MAERHCQTEGGQADTVAGPWTSCWDKNKTQKVASKIRWYGEHQTPVTASKLDPYTLVRGNDNLGGK